MPAIPDGPPVMFSPLASASTRIPNARVTMARYMPRSRPQTRPSTAATSAEAHAPATSPTRVGTP